MFGTIRKHQTWLWAVIITLTIISFVYFFSPYQKMNAGSGPINLGAIDGQRITREDYVQARNEVYLYHFITQGAWPEENRNGFDSERETYSRLFLLQKEKEFGIHVGDDVVARVARDMVRAFEKNGASALEAFKQELQRNGLSMADFERFVRHQVGVQELVSSVTAGARLITPQELKGMFVREHEEVATEGVFFPVSNYLASVNITPEAIATFFTNRMPNYRIPERVQVNYVLFPFTNYFSEATNLLAKMTNLDTQIEQAYRENPTNLLEQVKASSLEDAKVKIRERRLRDFETQAARRKAAEFAYQLDETNATGADALPRLAKQLGLTIGVTAPFDEYEGPKDLNVGPGFAKTAFALTNAPFAGPLLGDDAVYIISINKRLPSELPTFEQVRARVENDYKESLATAKALEEGLKFAETVTNQMAQGKTFAEVCAAAKVKPIELPPFSIATQSLADYDPTTLNQLKMAAFSTPPGKASEYYPRPNTGVSLDAGFVLFVKAKLPVSEEKMKKDFPAYATMVRSGRQNEMFQEWFRKETARSLPDIPYFRQQQQQQQGRTTKS